MEIKPTTKKKPKAKTLTQPEQGEKNTIKVQLDREEQWLVDQDAITYDDFVEWLYGKQEKQ